MWWVAGLGLALLVIWSLGICWIEREVYGNKEIGNGWFIFAAFILIIAAQSLEAHWMGL